jgi:hypothetical protein
MSNGPLIPVTEYQLTSDEVEVAFYSGNSGPPTLVLNGKVYRGGDLHLEETALGLVATVVLETIPDLHTITFSVTVPAANRPQGGRAVPICTFAVHTTARTSIAGPGLVFGQIQEYKLVALSGDGR